MPKKTDNNLKKEKRSRVRYSCKPELQDLFTLVNLFPQPRDWVAFDAPKNIPSSPFLFRNLLKKTGFTKDEIAQILQIYERGSELQKYLLNLDLRAYRVIIPENELENLIEITRKMSAADMKVEEAISTYLATRKDEDERHIDTEYQKYKEYENQWFEFARIIESWLARYNGIKKTKDVLTNIAFRGRNFEIAKKIFHPFEFVDIDGLLPKIHINENGLLQKEDYLLFEILIGVDITRIRQCAICRNFFWANRIDRQCCTKKCADVYNQRISREKKQLHGLQYKEASKRRKNKKP